MMGNLVRVLNEEGINKFRAYLAELRAGRRLEPPMESLVDPWTSAKLQVNVEIEERNFSSRLEAAKYLYKTLEPLGQAGLEQNIGLWTWLSLFYFNLLCPARPDGSRRPGVDYRFILDLHFRYYYRHLLAGAYTVCRLHGERAALLLYNPLSKSNKFHLELACRQGFLTNKGIIEAANLLYYDYHRKRPKRAAAVTTRKPGTLFRFIDVVQQLDLTYDLHSMTGKEVLNLLPSEFDEWRH